MSEKNNKRNLKKAKPDSDNIFFLGNFLEKRSSSESRRSYASPKIHFFFSEKKKGSKGQMFLISGIIILIGFFLLRGVFGIYTTLEEKRFQETMTIDRQMENIYREYEYVVAAGSVSSMPANRTSDYLYNLSEMVRQEEDAEIFYVYAFYNGTSSTYSVAVGNFLNDRINATINVTNSTTSSALLGVLDDKKNDTAQFSSSISSGIINVSVTYTLRGSQVTERFYVRASSQNFAAGLFDVKIKNENDFVRIKNVYNTTW